MDAGCGPGGVSARLAEMGYAVEAVDQAPLPEMAAVAERYPNVQYSIVDICRKPLPFPPGSFDAVVFVEVMEHLANPWAFIGAASGLLAEGGCLFLSIPNYWSLKYRIRYLLTGNIQRPFKAAPAELEAFRSGFLPHVNAIPWPVLRYALEAHALEVCHGPFPEKMYPLYRALVHLPFVLFVKGAQFFSSSKRKSRYALDQTNRLSILLGGPHAMIVARKSKPIPRSGVSRINFR